MKDFGYEGPLSNGVERMVGFEEPAFDRLSVCHPERISLPTCQWLR
jgi:hypothetical protein